MRRLVLMAIAMLMLGFVPPAEALTIREVIELSKAGLGEDVLLALIEVDGGVYAIDPATLKSLKDAQVPEKVIVALVRSGRERQPFEPPPPLPVEEPRSPEPQVVVIDHHDERQVREVIVPVPIYVPVGVSRIRRHADVSHTAIDSTFRPFQPGVPISELEIRREPKKKEPVYWGFGGRLRPDAWIPDGHKPGGHRVGGQKSEAPQVPESK